MIKIKTYILIAVVLLHTACSIKKDQGVPTQTSGIESLKILPDMDNDGISDELERKMGANPFIADIPKISIGLVQEISIGAIFKPKMENLLEYKFSMLSQGFSDIDSTKGGDLDSLKVLRRKVVKNQYNHLRNIKAEKTDIITNDDLRSNILSSWSDDQYYSYMNILPSSELIEENNSGKFVTNLKIKISNAANVTEISDISLKSFFFDYGSMTESEIYNHFLLKSSGSKERFKLSGNEGYAPVTIYPLVANELNSNEVYSRIADRSEIGIKFTDYSYVSSGVALNYAEVLNKVFDGNAKIVYSDGVKTDVFFVAPGLTVAETLKQLGKSIALNKDGDIYSINGIETTAKYPIDIDELRIDDLKKGIWSVFGDGDNLSEKMKPQGLYVVAYSTTKDILNISRNWVTAENAQVVDSITLKNIYEGDEVLFEVSGIAVTSIVESISETVKSQCPSSCETFAGASGPPSKACRNCRMCKDTVASASTVENEINIPLDKITQWFSVEGSYGEKIDVNFFKYGNKIKLIFNSLPLHLSNTVKIKFGNPLNVTSIARNGTLSTTCGRESYTTQVFNNQFKINGTVKIFGINKY